MDGRGALAMDLFVWIGSVSCVLTQEGALISRLPQGPNQIQTTWFEPRFFIHLIIIQNIKIN